MAPQYTQHKTLVVRFGNNFTHTIILNSKIHIPTKTKNAGKHISLLTSVLVAVTVGFEPTVAINYTAFRVLHLRPLGHVTSACNPSRISPKSTTQL